jgi:hypothetical protein
MVVRSTSGIIVANAPRQKTALGYLVRKRARSPKVVLVFKTSFLPTAH